MCTGIFFHYQQGERLRDFPEALGDILSKKNVFFFDAFYPTKPKTSFDIEPVPMDVLHSVHTPEMVERVKGTGEYEGALYSAAGTRSAALKINSGELKNAFVFTGYGDHHAGSTFFGGGCYFNSAAITIHELQHRSGMKRFAIVDTDAHHGDGTWELFQNNPAVLYLCFCDGDPRESNGNVNVYVPSRTNDDEYFELAQKTFKKWFSMFEPEIIFWNWGYDGTIGEYGDIGLTPGFHQRLALEIKKVAEEVCHGRLIIVLCGGSSRALVTFLIPRIIEVLSC